MKNSGTHEFHDASGRERRPPPIQDRLICTKLEDGIYNFSTPPVGFQEYLVLGKNRALLIDTGIGVCPLRAAVEACTKLPLTVINTHGHPDHAGGNAEFSPALMCPLDFDVFAQMATQEFRAQDLSHMPGGEALLAGLLPTGPQPLPVADGEMIDLGGRRLRVVYAPGHTHGSLCIHDETSGALFTGDNVQAGETALWERNAATVEQFCDSLRRMQALRPTKILGGHRPNVNEPELIGRVLRCAEAVFRGERGEPKSTRGGSTALCYTLDGVSICYAEDRVRCAGK